MTTYQQTDYQQTDWTGEQGGINPNLVLCANPKCLKPLEHDLLQVGRKADYCSDACKMKAYRQRQKSLRNAQHKELEKQLYQQILQLVFSQDYFGIEKSIFKAIQPGCEYWIISVKQKTSFGFVEYSKLKRFAPVGSLFPVELSVFEKSFDDCFSDLVSIANSDFVQNFALLPHNYVRLKSVESASNTHTKVLHTVLNDKNSRAINTHTKVWNPVLFQQNKAG